MAFVFQRESSKQARSKQRVQVLKCEKGSVEYEFQSVRLIPQSAFNSTYLNVFDLSIAPKTEAVKAKMRAGPTIGSLYDILFGLKTADDAKFLHFVKGLHSEDEPLLRGNDVHRYGFSWKGEYVWYVPGRMTKHRRTARPGEAARFERSKVLVKDTTKDFSCTYEDGTYYVKDVLIVLPKANALAYDLKALAGIINSKALRFFYRSTFNTLHVQNKELASLPLPELDLNNKRDKASHDRLVALVTQILQAEEQRTKAVTEASISYLEGRIETLDRQIDDLVCSLYGLNAVDRALIESNV
jgi:hypothetical protein